MSTASKNISNMDAKSTNVSTSLARDPEDTHITLLIIVEELGLINGTDT
jgi:hypothetical protein